jgi:predicted phosphodiesterase
MRRTAFALVVAALAGSLLAAGPATELPNAPSSLKLAVIGDNGSGDRREDELAAQMAASHKRFSFGLVLMVGDNFYGSQKPADLEHKFARPYRRLLDAGVVFQAALGNHDDVSTIGYAPINMGGQRYYTFVRQNVRFFVLDTNVLDAAQLKWAEAALQQSTEPWKIAYFHHPLYSNARRHGSNVDIRVRLEPLLLKYGVQVVFAGHDHVYERLKPQKGIYYFVAGSAGKLRKGDLGPSDTTAAGFDQDNAFMLVEILGDDLYFEAVSRTGAIVDSGQIRRMTPRIGS